MEKIPNLEVYNSNMKKSLIDKIFFVDKVEATRFVDFGCADGTMIGFLKQIFPEFSYLGYDISTEMLEVAKKANPSIPFVSTWEQVHEFCGKSHDETALILSSVIHELYSYCSQEEIENTWSLVFDSGFEYVVIRDMMASSSAHRQSNINDIAKITRCLPYVKIEEFEGNFGSIRDNYNLLHLLLKYRYVANWEREVKENYLPLNFESFLRLIPSKYEIIFCEHYTLPFLRSQVSKDLGINIVDNTHAKFILRRK